MKIKKFFIQFWPVFFIAIIWFLFASPYFIKGKVPYASTYHVNFFQPWSHYEKFWGPVKNNAMPDVHTQIYPWKKFTIETLKNGQIPLWNPYSFSGNPHLANFQSAVLSPFNFLFFVFSFIDAWSILVLLQPLLAGLFMYLLMRSFKISKTGATLSSVTFMFCGFIVVWMAYATLSMAIAFLPLGLFAIEKAREKPTKLLLALLSLTIPLSFFSGHFQTSFYFFIYICSFFIFRALRTNKKQISFLLLLFIIFGVLLSLPQVLPSIEFYFSSVRSDLFLKGVGIPIYYLITVVAPDFFGNPVTRNDWFGFYAEWSSFIGIIPLALAFIALIKRKNKLPLYFLFVGIITLLLSLETPLLRFIEALKIPVISTSNPTRIIVLFSFSFAVLCGFGLDRLFELIYKKEPKKQVFIILLTIGAVLLLVWIALFAFAILPIDKLIIAKRNLVLPSLLFLSLCFLVLMNLYLRNKTVLVVSLAILMLLSSFDSFRFAQKWMPFDPKQLVYPPLSSLESMKKEIGNGRYFGNLGGEVSVYYGLSSIEGYDPLYIERYGEFIRSAATSEFLKGERSLVRLARDGKYTDRVLDQLNVSLIYHPIADTNQGWAYPIWKNPQRSPNIFENDRIQLFKNNAALERAVLYYDYDVVKEKKELLKRFYSNDFDFRNTLLLEEEPFLKVKKDKDVIEKGRAIITEYTPNKVTITSSSPKSALLFLSDNYYPGWEAKVDGRKTPIYRANYTFRAVPVEKGEHTIVFIYKPLSFSLGVFFAMVSLGFILFLFLFGRKLTLTFSA